MSAGLVKSGSSGGERGSLFAIPRDAGPYLNV